MRRRAPRCAMPSGRCVRRRWWSMPCMARSPTALLFPADVDRVPAPREVGPRRPAADRFETLSWTSERPVSLAAIAAGDRPAGAEARAGEGIVRDGGAARAADGVSTRRRARDAGARRGAGGRGAAHADRLHCRDRAFSRAPRSMSSWRDASKQDDGTISLRVSKRLCHRRSHACHAKHGCDGHIELTAQRAPPIVSADGSLRGSKRNAVRG